MPLYQEWDSAPYSTRYHLFYSQRNSSPYSSPNIQTPLVCYGDRVKERIPESAWLLVKQLTCFSDQTLFSGLTSTLSFRCLAPPMSEPSRGSKRTRCFFFSLLLRSHSVVYCWPSASHTQNLVAVVSFPFLHGNKALKKSLYDHFQWSLRWEWKIMHVPQWEAPLSMEFSRQEYWSG